MQKAISCKMLSANISHSLHSKCYKRHMIYFIIGGELVGGNNISLRKCEINLILHDQTAILSASDKLSLISSEILKSDSSEK